MVTNVTNPFDVILKEISIIATNMATAPYYAETILDYMEKKYISVPMKMAKEILLKNS